jgi:hypothetical protein
MPHQNFDSSKATAQNAATDPAAPRVQGDAAGRQEPRSYAAPDVAESSLAPPAAGEVADYMDEGDALAADDVQSGGNHANRPGRTEVMSDQGPKTTAGNKERIRSGSADGA